MKKVSDLLREYQYKNNLTQHEMSKFLGIAQSTYNNWVNGKSMINPNKYFYKVADICEVDILSILPNNLSLDKKIWKNHDIESLLNALEFCQKYSKCLEENLLSLKIEKEQQQKRIEELEILLRV
jgi:transcriptional regulator with XRE-family HTH domain